MNLPKEYRELLKPKSVDSKIGTLLRTQANIHTVCEEAMCPNRGECFKEGTATFLILGNICTRNCAFCAIEHGYPQMPEIEEIDEIIDAIKEMELRYVVLTSVTRDDLNDGGASYFNSTVKAIKESIRDIKIEILIPDFKKNPDNLKYIENKYTDVLNHNIETVKELYSVIRPEADYNISFEILKAAKNRNFITKTGIMLGLGETEHQIQEVISDISNANVDILTIGQYIKPRKNNFAVEKYYSQDEFDNWADYAYKKGIRKVISGVFVRSSYHAHSIYKELN
ncbi:lipoyl synthase [candidate division WOR-3 bacterium]|nr:lipoyl synthase [candidate division WOR-3 bacterium]